MVSTTLQFACIPEGISQGPACHWIIDRDLLIDWAAGHCEAFLGRPADGLIGRNLLDCLDLESDQAWRFRISRVFAGETILIREKRGDAIFAVSLFPIYQGDGRTLRVGAIAQNITAISAADRELRKSALRVMKSQENDRVRLTELLHDDVCQALSSTGIQLDLLRMDLESDVPGVGGRVAEIQKNLDCVIRRVRDFSYEFNPAIVERTGLRTALDLLAGRTRSLFAGQFRLLQDSTVHFLPQVASAVYRIVQEAVENAIYHASASSISVMLKNTRQGPTVEVRDNGKGFDSADVLHCGRGLGLLAMEHHAALAGLELSITSRPGEGTLVSAVYPKTAPVLREEERCTT